MKHFLFFAAMLLPFAIWAQPNYHEGYVIKNNGDTLKGFVNYREWVYSPEYIEFRADKANGPVLKFTANSINGFGVSGFEAYKSYVGDITLNKNIFPNIPSGLDTSHQVRAIFLKPIRRGTKLDFYYNNEPDKDRFFIAEKGGQPAELKYYAYYNSSSAEVFGNIYVTQLQLLAAKYVNGNKKIADKLENPRYELRFIKEIVDEINGVDPVEQQKADSVKSANSPAFVRFIAGLAVNYTVNSAPNTKASSAKYNAGVDIFLNPNVQQLIIRLELGYTAFSSSVAEQVIQSNGQLATANQQVTQYSFSFNPQLIFNIYNTEPFKYYIDAGASMNFSSYSDQSGLTPFLLSAPFQTGVVFNRKLELFVSYSFKSKYRGASYYDSNQSTCAGVKLLF